MSIQHQADLEPLIGGTADPDAVADWVEGLTPGQLECRDFGHSWKPYTAHYAPNGSSIIRVLKCPRCKTEREQEIDSHGRISGGGYKYKQGFLAPKGTGRLDGDAKGVLRLMSVENELARANEIKNNGRRQSTKR